MVGGLWVSVSMPGSTCVHISSHVQCSAHVGDSSWHDGTRAVHTCACVCPLCLSVQIRWGLGAVARELGLSERGVRLHVHGVTVDIMTVRGMDVCGRVWDTQECISVHTECVYKHALPCCGCIVAV